ncbi:MAG: LysR family transcriptional regulator [Oscillospiraceae bacterium]|nr:LysR family transcriptional regulator [Oscillospiraceae bacterium]
MELTQLRYFQAVARTGNITKAARLLYITQPNLSKSIARLEAELGVPLFDHRKGKVLLNDYGRMFLSSVDIVFSELEAGTRTVQRMYEANQHILSLASNVPNYLPDILPAFSSANPDIGIRQRDESTQQMVEHLLDHSISLAISNEVLKDPSIQFTQLSQTRYMVAVGQGHPLAQQEEVSLADLAGETLICDSGRLCSESLICLCQEHGFIPTIGFEVQSTELLYHLLTGGHGPAIIPMTLGCQIIHDHGDCPIRLVPIRDEMPPVILGIGYRKDEPPTEAVERFTAYLKECIQCEVELVRSLGYEPN